MKILKLHETWVGLGYDFSRVLLQLFRGLPPRPFRLLGFWPDCCFECFLLGDTAKPYHLSPSTYHLATDKWLEVV